MRVYSVVVLEAMRRCDFWRIVILVECRESTRMLFMLVIRLVKNGLARVDDIATLFDITSKHVRSREINIKALSAARLLQ